MFQPKKHSRPKLAFHQSFLIRNPETQDVAPENTKAMKFGLRVFNGYKNVKIKSIAYICRRFKARHNTTKYVPY